MGKDSARTMLAMKAPSLVATEMAKDATPDAGYSVGDGGLILFQASGAHADKAIRRAAALTAHCQIRRWATYRDKTRAMPESTEVERVAKQRVGQDIFRASLEDYWGGYCPITGISDRALLRASHTKPWTECAADDERLDVHNGFLLAVHVDAAFDAALLTIDPDSAIQLSSKLLERQRRC
jgi:putative restriction endonuclease